MPGNLDALMLTTIILRTLYHLKMYTKCNKCLFSIFFFDKCLLNKTLLCCVCFCVCNSCQSAVEMLRTQPVEHQSRISVTTFIFVKHML